VTGVIYADRWEPTASQTSCTYILSGGFEHTYADMAAISASDLVKASMLAWDIYNYGFAKECNASK